jgi:hypothetical protein
MKHTMLKTLSILGISLMMTASVAAQEEPKVKVNDNEYKYKSEDLKMKGNEEESKYKAKDLKIKENDEERKVKGKVKPMRLTTTERTVMKTGETQIRAKEQLAPINTLEPVVPAPTPVVVEQVAVPKTASTVKKTGTRKYAAKKSTARKHIAARKSSTAPRTIVRTKIVRDTVYVPSPPPQMLATQTEYVHDTVFITRVDTVLRMQSTNNYAGYRVPAGDFKKVKLKKDKDGDVWMKRKE